MKGVTHSYHMGCYGAFPGISSLFSDGFISYSMYDEDSFREDVAAENQLGYCICSSHEIIIPDSTDNMTWDISEHTFLMTLSRKVPILIRKCIHQFVSEICLRQFNKIYLSKV